MNKLKLNLQFFASNQEVIERSYTGTRGNGVSLLSPEQSKTFMRMVMDGDSFLKSISHEMRTSVKGSLPKLGVKRGIIQRKIEGDMPKGEGNKIIFDAVNYDCNTIMTYTALSNDWKRQNIEQRHGENAVMEEIAKRTRIDIINLILNGDTELEESHELHESLSIDDGIIKQLKKANQLMDCSTYSTMSAKLFIDAVTRIPQKYLNTKAYKWIANNLTYFKWIEELTQRQTSAGDAAMISDNLLKPLGIDWEIVADMPDNTIILGDPKNIALVNTFDTKLNKTSEGKDALLRDMTYYAMFMDVDTIIYEKEAMLLMENIGKNPITKGKAK